MTLEPKKKIEPVNTSIDDWVNNRDKNFRTTFDIPSEMHAALKSKCASERRKMRDVILEALEQYLNK